MRKKNATELLKERIARLEVKQAVQGAAFKSELLAAYENLKPVNLIKNSVKEIISSDEIKKSLFESSVLMINSFLAKQFIKAGSNNLLLKIISTLLQLGISNLVINNKNSISQFISNLFDKILSFGKRETVESESSAIRD